MWLEFVKAKIALVIIDFLWAIFVGVALFVFSAWLFRDEKKVK